MEGTCQWIFDASQFTSWIKDTMSPHIIGIHGRVGSGKSTLSKYMAGSLRDKSRFPQQIVLSFFLGSTKHGKPQSTPAEIYRSLLVQILRESYFKEDAARLMKDRSMSKLILNGGEDDWPSRLCNVIKDLFRKWRLRSNKAVIIIDAIDNCTDTDALVQFFQDMTLLRCDANLKILFTSRQRFPIIDRICTHIAIETYNQDDIAFYIKQRLDVGDLIGIQNQNLLQQAIEEEASGIFLWVVLVTNIIRGYVAQGKDYKQLIAIIETTPKEMTELCRDIVHHAVALNEQEQIRTTLHVLQWVLFSARRLTLEEWHHVFAFIDNPNLRSIDEWRRSPSYTESDTQLLQRIDRACCGLVDARDQQTLMKAYDIASDAGSLAAGAGSFESHQFIDFIHSSVRSFFLNEGGFGMLDKTIKDPVEAGHAYLLEICIRYSFLAEMVEMFKITSESPLGSRPQSLHSRSSARIQPWTKTKVLLKKNSEQIHEPADDWTDDEEDDDSEMFVYGSSTGSSIHSRHSMRRSRMQFTVPRKSRFMFQRRTHLGTDDEEDDSDRMSLGSSAGSSFHSSHSRRVPHVPVIIGNKTRLKTHRRTQMPLLSLVTSLDTLALKVLNCQEDTATMSDYLRGLHLAGLGNLDEELIPPIPNSPIGSLGSQCKFHPASQKPPSLWQYCQHMLVHHATVVESTGFVPEKALDFLLRQDTTAWLATHKDMQYRATIAYFAARWDLSSWLKYFALADLLDVPGGRLTYPIIVAAKYNCGKAFAYLLSETQSSGLSCTDTQQRTALHYAAMSPDGSIIHRVCEASKANPTLVKQVDINQRDSFGWTALHLAVLYASIPKIMALLDLGADVNLLDERGGNTVLHLACFRENIRFGVCKLLVKAGCNHRLRNKVGMTALQYAQNSRDHKVANYLAKLSPPASQKSRGRRDVVHRYAGFYRRFLHETPTEHSSLLRDGSPVPETKRSASFLKSCFCCC
jgi:Cdc6-like AAA superfamily ATPase